MPAVDFPQCRWVTVTDADGRRRLEMRWHPPVVPVLEQLADPCAADVVALAA